MRFIEQLTPDRGKIKEKISKAYIGTKSPFVIVFVVYYLTVLNDPLYGYEYLIRLLSSRSLRKEVDIYSALFYFYVQSKPFSYFFYVLLAGLGSTRNMFPSVRRNKINN